MLGVPYNGERAQVYWFDKDYQKYQAMINEALPGMANDIKNWSRKQDLILFHSHSEKTIGTYYLLDISNISLSFGDKNLFSDLSFFVNRVDVVVS